MTHQSVPIRALTPQQAYARGYSRGYSERRANQWPQTVPNPPVEEFAKYHDAVIELRNQLDVWQAGLSRDDEWAVQLNAMLDIIDDADIAFSQWLKEQIEDRA